MQIDHSLENVINKEAIERFSAVKPLVDTLGSKFTLMDREATFKIFADALNERYHHWKRGAIDRNCHPIPFLAAGPGTGKSRFLQELHSSFKQFIINSNSCSESLKETYSNALFINISFGNGTLYNADDIKMGIEKAVCYRILSQIIDKTDVLITELNLVKLLKLLAIDCKCIVLGIDEINRIHEKDKNEFKSLIEIIGSLSIAFKPFFIPVFAGTVIGSIEDVITRSSHPPLELPLPLLSYESCKNIFINMNASFSEEIDANTNIQHVISDMGGHCRALEFLYSVLMESSDLYDFERSKDKVIHMLNSRYTFKSYNLQGAIAYSFLGVRTKSVDTVPGGVNLQFKDLEEQGLLKIEHGIVKMPWIFVCCWLEASSSSSVTRLWQHLLIERDFFWQNWEKFNRNYFAFRLSLYSVLGRKELRLSEYLSGATINIPDSMILKVPSIDHICVDVAKHRYPTTETPSFDIGTFVLNCSGAPFDAFCWLELVSNDTILLTLEMKLAMPESNRGQAIKNSKINQTFLKINDSMAAYLPGSQFVVIILGRCNGDFKQKDLPGKCAVITKDQQRHFYGDAFYRRLNRQNDQE